MKTLFALAFLFCFSFASGLKCYTCTSTTSLEECEKNQKETDCVSSALDRCLTFTANFTIANVETKSFIKSCQAKSYCDTSETLLKSCNDAGGKCKLDCCDTDLCNGGSALVVNGDLSNGGSASGLKCYTCTSTTSLEECEKNQKETDCVSSALDRCLTFTANFTIANVETKSFIKSCQAKSYCDTSETLLKSCNDAGGKCKLDCCDTDLCNGGSALVVNGDLSNGGSASGLKCYTCTSTTSLEECEKNQKETDCVSSALDRCGTFTTNFTIANVETKSFIKSCLAKSYCNTSETLLKPCNDAGGKCKLDCCDTDLCNGGSALVVNGDLSNGGSASGLKCYTCTSTTSLEECEKNQKETDCVSSALDRCGTFTMNFTIANVETKSFIKSCLAKSYCDTSETLLKPCNDAGGKCKLDCCDTDLCNGASALVVNGDLFSGGSAPVVNGDLSNGGSAPVVNGGSAPVVSVLVMVACAAMYLLR